MIDLTQPATPTTIPAARTVAAATATMLQMLKDKPLDALKGLEAFQEVLERLSTSPGSQEVTAINKTVVTLLTTDDEDGLKTALSYMEGQHQGAMDKAAELNALVVDTKPLVVPGYEELDVGPMELGHPSKHYSILRIDHPTMESEEWYRAFKDLEAEALTKASHVAGIVLGYEGQGSALSGGYAFVVPFVPTAVPTETPSLVLNLTVGYGNMVIQFSEESLTAKHVNRALTLFELLTQQVALSFQVELSRSEALGFTAALRVIGAIRKNYANQAGPVNPLEGSDFLQLGVATDGLKVIGLLAEA